MKLNSNILIGFLLGFVAAGCVTAAAQFNYNWFYPEFVSYEGKLIGKKPEDDLDSKVCMKDIQGNHPCIVMLKPEFNTLVKDKLKDANDLIACQQALNVCQAMLR